MKEKELMVGDWVKDWGTPKQIEYGCEIEDAEFYEPVIITKEILKKNGFERDGAYSRVYRKKTMYGYITSSPSLHQATLHAAIPHNGLDYDITLTSCYYVHELQHAMKLVGLYEMANEFKVDK